jgi:hypothetical protein
MSAPKLTRTERHVLAFLLAGCMDPVPEWNVLPGHSPEELRELARKLGIERDFEDAVVWKRSEDAGLDVPTHGLLQ